VLRLGAVLAHELGASAVPAGADAACLANDASA
jgi:hypothetical protein